MRCFLLSLILAFGFLGAGLVVSHYMGVRQEAQYVDTQRKLDDTVTQQNVSRPLGACGNLSPSISIPTSTGSVPFAVFADGTGTTDSGFTTQPFHDLLYTWDFGDASAGTWTTTTGGGNTSRNAAYGPIAAHVYENAGTYTVTLTVHDRRNTCSATTTVTANAWTDDTNTVCVSTSGTFMGCAFGTQVTTSSWSRAMGNLSSTRKRILFRCGETWTANAYTIGANGERTGPGMVGAYNDSGMVTATNSTCTKPKVNSGSGLIAIGLGSSAGALTDWRISDIEISGQSFTNPSGGGVEPDGSFQNRGGSKVLLLRMNIHDIVNPISFQYFGSMLADWDQISIVDTTVSGVIGGAGVVGFWYEGTRLAMLGNNMNDSTAAEHVVRLQYATKSVVSNNVFTNAASTKASLTVRGPCRTGSSGCSVLGGGGSNRTQYVVVSDNKLGQTSGEYGGPLIIRPENSTSIEIVEDVIAERNFLMRASIEARDTRRVTIRTNLIDTTTGTRNSYRGVEVSHDSSVGVACDSNWIYNNSTYTGDSANDISNIFISSSSCTNTMVKNNIAYAPSFPDDFHTRSVESNSTGTTGGSGNNGNTADSGGGGQMKSTNPFAASPPGTTIANWRAANYASSGGVAATGVYKDFNLVNVNMARDAGAVNH